MRAKAYPWENIAEALGVGLSTLKRWRRRYSNVREALEVRAEAECAEYLADLAGFAVVGHFRAVAAGKQQPNALLIQRALAKRFSHFAEKSTDTESGDAELVASLNRARLKAVE